MSDTNKLPLPKLLLPAGSFAALDAALDGGADEIYFGGKCFNARMSADNFTNEEIREAIIKCHFFGVSTNITINTLILEKEYDELLRFVEFIYKNDCDALICADLGAASLIKKYFPDLSLHASTQCAANNAYGADFLKGIGFDRVVPARELSFGDLVMMKRAVSDIEYEIFVHGAICVCHSGMCEMSNFMGKRSGNRGECAQPCRLPYNNGEYPLSIKDMCLSDYIVPIIKSGVTSLKIEGRMKSPEYVYGVGKIYRTLLDERRNATADENLFLRKLFSRSGFTDGYFTKNTGIHMLGVRTDSDKEASKAAQATAAYDRRNNVRRLNVKMSAQFCRGEASQLIVTCNGLAETVYGMKPEAAKTSPTTAALAAKNLMKTGNTPFKVTTDDVNVIIDSDVMIPVSTINSMRRTALEKLVVKIPTTFYPERADFSLSRDSNDDDEYTFSSKAGRSIAHFTHASLMPPRIYLGLFSHIFLPVTEYVNANDEVRSCVDGISLPPVAMQSELDELEALVVSAKLSGIKNCFVQNIGSFMLAKKYGFEIYAGYSMNAYSKRTARVLYNAGAHEVMLSPELSLSQIKAITRDAGVPTGAMVYGRVQMMLLEKCIIRDMKFKDKAPEYDKCEYCLNVPYSTLCDRLNTKFPVTRSYKHRNIIYNSVPTYMADKQDEISGGAVGSKHFFFTNETPAQAAIIIESYKSNIKSENEIRRM